jgi:hypothetical protein
MSDHLWAQSLDGPDWEEEIFLLLQIRHGPNHVQRVPAVDHGDLGIDAFCLSDGSVYQCYAPQGASAVRERYTRHRKKMTEDVDKFIDRRDKISAVLGNLRISRWILTVPLNDSKEILEHAATKAQLVRDAGLPYVASDFQILVQDAQDFKLERREAVLRGARSLDVPVDEVEEHRILQWIGENNPLVASLRRKLQAIHPHENSEYLAERIDVLITAFIQGENLLSRLSQDHPDLWEKVQREIKRTERRLVVTGRDSATQPGVTFRRELAAFADALEESRVLVSATTADSISHGKVADWLMRCPLDFPEVA